MSRVDNATGHQTLRAWADAGGQPVEHPEVHALLYVAAHERYVGRYQRLRQVSAELARLNDSAPLASPAEDEAEDARLRAVYLWIVELLVDDDLADWFLSGLPAEEVERQRREADAARHQPFVAALTHTGEPFRCAVSGRTDGAIALRIEHRTDPTVPVLLLHPAIVMGVIEDGLARLERAVDAIASADGAGALTDETPDDP